MMEAIRPGIVIDDNTFYPPGWMYILAFASRGFKWAMDQAETEEFKEQIRQWMEAKIDSEIKQIKEHCQKLIDGLEEKKRRLRP